MEEYVQTAVEASSLGAEIHKKGFRKARKVEYKAPRSLVTEVDLEAEEAIKEHISSEYPDHDILAEETGEKDTGSAYRWLVDPLDGTTNFVHGVPDFAVSIALEVEGEIRIGVVHNTPMQKTYSAVKGEGAYVKEGSLPKTDVERKEDTLSVSPQESFSESLICTGFSRKSADDDIEFRMLRTMIRDTHGVRRMGTAATDLCMVAEGIFDGFYEKHLKPWDIAAGVLIVEEANGKVTDFERENDFLQTGEVVASNEKIHDEIIETYRNSQK